METVGFASVFLNSVGFRDISGPRAHGHFWCFRTPAWPWRKDVPEVHNRYELQKRHRDRNHGSSTYEHRRSAIIEGRAFDALGWDEPGDLPKILVSQMFNHLDDVFSCSSAIIIAVMTTVVIIIAIATSSHCVVSKWQKRCKYVWFGHVCTRHCCMKLTNAVTTSVLGMVASRTGVAVQAPCAPAANP